jgi:hypothetical protein
MLPSVVGDHASMDDAGTASACDVQHEVDDSRIDNESIGCGSGDSGHFSLDVAAVATELKNCNSTLHQPDDATPPVASIVKNKIDHLSSASLVADGRFRSASCC